MSWIKIDNDTYALEATPDPQLVVSISALENEIADLQSRIDSIHLIEIPKGASEEVVIAIEKSNEFPRGEVVMFQTQLDEKTKLLEELKKL